MSKGSRAPAARRELAKVGRDKRMLFAYLYGAGHARVSLSAVRREYARRGVKLVRPGYVPNDPNRIKGRRVTFAIMDEVDYAADLRTGMDYPQAWERGHWPGRWA